MTRRCHILTAMLCCLLVACAGQKAYRSDHKANMFIRTNTESRGWFSGVEASLDIFEMHDICDVDYRGTVNLDDSLIEVGIPEGVPAYLVFRVDSSAFLTNTRSSLGYDVTLYPAHGQVYDVNVTYRDNVYSVEVDERSPGEIAGQRLAIGMIEHDCGIGI